MKKNKITHLLFSFVIFSLLAAFQLCANPLVQRSDVKAFIHQVSQKHQFDEKQLTAWIAKATLQPDILKTIAKPAETLPWFKYQPIFITPQRIEAGVNFWQQHASTLEKAQQTYGVPPEIIVAIIGVESFYGKKSGGYSVLDALVTLAFDYPPRSKFFMSELEEFLLLCREENWDPASIQGSYAGAMGIPQFIASSYRQYSVDFNQHGKRDLIHSNEDAIGSVANYFKRHGWENGGIIALPVKLLPYYQNQVIGTKGKPFYVIALEAKSGLEYWLGAQNFYVITRYNHSDHYAMAVFELSNKIKAAYQQVG